MDLINFENLLEKEGFEIVEDNTDALHYGLRVFKRDNRTSKEIVTTNLIKKDKGKNET